MALIVGIAAVGVIGLLGFQVGMNYLDKNTIRGAVKAVLKEEKDMGPNAIKNAILGKLVTNSFEVPQDDLEVTKSGSRVTVKLDMRRTIKITSDIRIVQDLSFEESS